MRKPTPKDAGAARHEEINLRATPVEILDKAIAMHEAWLTRLHGDELIEQMQMFAEEVTPNVNNLR